MKNILLLIGMSALLSVSACKKKDDNGGSNSSTAKPADITGKSHQEIFMIQKWTITSWRDSTDAGDFQGITACSLDDTYDFTTTTSYTMNNGANKCNSADPQEVMGTWNMPSASSNTVTMFSYTWTITKMTGENIYMQRDLLTSNDVGKSYIIWTWSH